MMMPMDVPSGTDLVLTLDTAKNREEIHSKSEHEWEHGHGTRVEIEMEARYQKGLRSVDMYLKQTAIASKLFARQLVQISSFVLTRMPATTLIPRSG